MSYFVKTRTAQPSNPATDKFLNFVDSIDNRDKTISYQGNVLVNTPYGWRDNNIITNGEFDYAQRQAPATLTTYSSLLGRIYGPDRFGMTNENASIQFQRIDTAAAFETNNQPRYYGKFKKITAAGKILITQVVENCNMAHLKGRYIRVQVKMKYSVAASMSVRLGLINNTGTADTVSNSAFLTAFNGANVDLSLGSNLAYILPSTSNGVGALTPENCTANGNAFDCALTAGWVRYSGMFFVPTTSKNLIFAVWSNSQLAANDELNMSEVGIYEGFETRDWFPRLQADQLLMCQRYYAKTFPTDTAPAQGIGSNNGALQGILGKAAATALAFQAQWRFPISMRTTAPTITLFNPITAASAQARQISGTAADLTGTAASNTSDNSTLVTATGAAGGAVGDLVSVHITADAEL